MRLKQSPYVEKNENGIAIRRFPVVVHSKGLVIHLIPKVASTAIGKAIKTMNPEYIHINRVKDYEKYRRVVIVRNPFDRLVSCWADKINSEVGNKTWAKRFVEPIGLPHGTPFDVWARAVCKHPDDQSDRHYRTQTALVTHEGEFLPTEIVKVEDGTFWDVLGIDPWDGGKKVNHTPRKPYQEYYDDELIELVAERYKEDLQRFGYKFEEK